MAVGLLVWCLCLLLIACLYLVSRPKKLAFPGPKGLPFLGCFFQVRNKPVPQVFSKWNAQYGAVFAFSLLGKQRLVASSPEALHEILITRSKDFAGRPQSFSDGIRTNGNQNILRQNNLALHRILRQTSQSVLNIYGRARGKVEAILDTAVNNLVDNFHGKNGLPFDAWNSLYEATSLTIIMILTGRGPKDQTNWFRDFKRLNELLTGVMNVNFDQMLLDAIPAVRYLPWCPPYARLLKCVAEQDALSEKYLLSLKDEDEDGEHRSLGRALLDSIGQPYGDEERLEAGYKPGHITMANVKQVCNDIIMAGTLTTSSSFYALLGVLVCYPDIQEKVAEEIKAVVGTGSDCKLTLDHKDSLHYTRAVIFELLRYTSVAGLGFPHVARKNTELCGIPVPAGTEVFTNLWGCHHDPNFWTEPWVFNPNRFLSEEGYLVAADHPNRKHMFPFGAGMRVCLGELLATNRLFLFTASVVRQFKLLPGEEDVTCDARTYEFRGVTQPKRFKLCAIPRNKDA